MFPRAPVKHQRFQHLSLQEEAVQVLRVWYDDSSGVEDHSPGSLLAPVLVSLLQGNATLHSRHSAADLRPLQGSQTRLHWALLPTHRHRLSFIIQMH